MLSARALAFVDFKYIFPSLIQWWMGGLAWLLVKINLTFLSPLLFCTMSYLEWCHRFPHILTLATEACCQVYHIWAVTVHFLLDKILSSCVWAPKFFCFFDNWTSNSAMVTFLATPTCSSLFIYIYMYIYILLQCFL